MTEKVVRAGYYQGIFVSFAENQATATDYWHLHALNSYVLVDSGRSSFRLLGRELL